MRTMPGDRLWTPMWRTPAAARSSASDALSCVSADFVLLCVHAVFESCARRDRKVSLPPSTVWACLALSRVPTWQRHDTDACMQTQYKTVRGRTKAVRCFCKGRRSDMHSAVSEYWIFRTLSHWPRDPARRPGTDTLDSDLCAPRREAHVEDVVQRLCGTRL